MLISAKTTRPISFFFTQKEAQQLFRQLENIISQKYCCVEMREPKNQMLGTIVPPMQLSVKHLLII